MHGVFLMAAPAATTQGRRKQRLQRLESASDGLLAAIFRGGESSLADVDLEYLSAAACGDLAAVQAAIQDFNANLNCVDQLGRSALELALIGEHDAVVEYLLPRSNLQCLEDALLYCISKDNVRTCELILDHPLYNNHRIKLSSLDGIYQRDTESPRLRPTTTPIILAAQRNNFYIVQLLLTRGATIVPPHDYFCDCIECSNTRVFDSVKYSRSRLATFQALSSPAYMTLSSEDPILVAFRLSHQLGQLAEIEKEYKSEYRQLSEACKNYAVELLDLCQSTEEILSVLNECDDEVPEPDYTNCGLARLKLALKYEQKRFISHATCQRQLISLWYSGIPWMKYQHIAVKLLAVPIASLLLPFTTFVFLVAPKSKFSHVMRSPFVKFLHHTCAYVVFLLLVFMIALRQGSTYPWLDMACQGIVESMPQSVVSILIGVWVLGMFVHECRQLLHDGPGIYMSDWWNWMDSLIITLYMAHYAIQIVVFVKLSLCDEETRELICPDIDTNYTCTYRSCMVDAEVYAYTSGQEGTCSGVDQLYQERSRGEAVDTLSDMNQLSDIFFALANVLSFARVAHLLPANEQLGPLLTSFGRMLHDVSRWFIVFLLVFLAFLCGLTSLYRVHECENNHFSRVDQTLSSLFWATFGMGDTKSAHLDDRYLASRDELIQTHTSHHNFTMVFGYGLLWTYILAAVMVMLNMLIAMMSNSFQEIYDDRDVEWKFARAKLWSDYFEDGCTLPTPFNLIPNPKYIYRSAVWIKGKLFRTRKEPPVQMAYIYARRKNGMQNEDINNVELPQRPESLFKRTTRRLIQRYVFKKQMELACRLDKEHEIDDLRQDVNTMINNVEKLRLEINQIKTNSKGQGKKPPNGVSPNIAVSRTELQL